MDAHEAIKQLYQKEINVYKQQIEDLRQHKRSADEKNIALIEKLRELESLLEKASVANKDLHTAFEHVREENLKLKLAPANQFNELQEQIDNDHNEKALEVVERQYIDLARESVGWIAEKDKMMQRNKFLERECERYLQDNRKLGRQIQCLIRTLEEERGMIISSSSARPNSSGMNAMTASDVIDEHLVTFKSIEELQQQNQKLLSLVNYLSNKEEERQMSAENDDIARLNSDIEALKTQLQNVKNDRERIINAFDTLMKERDLFKILLSKSRDVEHMTPEILQRMVSIACSARPAITNAPEENQDKGAHVDDLKGIIYKLELDLTSLREEFASSKTRLEDELRLKTELLEDAHLKIVKESEVSEQLIEKNRVLEDNIKTIMTEFDESRTKMQRLSFELEQAKNEKNNLLDSLEQEKRSRQSELHAILSEINSKCELRDEIREYQLKLEVAQCKIEELNNGIMEMARLRNIERNQRVELTRTVHKLNSAAEQTALRQQARREKANSRIILKQRSEPAQPNQPAQSSTSFQPTYRPCPKSQQAQMNRPAPASVQLARAIRFGSQKQTDLLKRSEPSSQPAPEMKLSPKSQPVQTELPSRPSLQSTQPNSIDPPTSVDKTVFNEPLVSADPSQQKNELTTMNQSQPVYNESLTIKDKPVFSIQPVTAIQTTPSNQPNSAQQQDQPSQKFILKRRKLM